MKSLACVSWSWLDDATHLELTESLKAQARCDGFHVEAAEDLVGDVWLELCEGVASGEFVFSNERALRSWLFNRLRYAELTLLRSEKLRINHEATAASLSMRGLPGRSKRIASPIAEDILSVSTATREMIRQLAKECDLPETEVLKVAVEEAYRNGGIRQASSQSN